MESYGALLFMFCLLLQWDHCHAYGAFGHLVNRQYWAAGAMGHRELQLWSHAKISSAAVMAFAFGSGCPLSKVAML